MITVKYLLWLSDRVGVAAEEYSVEDCIPLRRLVEFAAGRHKYLAEHIEELFSPGSKLIVLVNGRRGWPDTPVCGGDTVAITPIVSGG